MFVMGEMYRFSGTCRHLAGEEEKALAELGEGIDVIGRVLRQEPGHRESRLAASGLHFSRATTLERLGRKAEAIRAWDLAVEYGATDARDRSYEVAIHVARARALLRLGETRRAVTEAIQFAEKPGLQGEHFRELAYVFALAIEVPNRDETLTEADLAARVLSCLRRCQEAGYFKDP